VTDLSFPAFVYEKYTANADNLEEGLFKGKILLQVRCTRVTVARKQSHCCLQGYKAIFTSPSSAKDVEGDGDGADVIANNRRTKQSSCGVKVKKHVAQIIKMDKVTPRSIAYVACQVSHDSVFQSVSNDHHPGRYDLHFLQLPLGGPLTATSTIFNSGGPSWTSSRSPLVEKRNAESINSLSGGQGAVFTVISISPD
jgi:hypothetical protein